MAMDHPEENYAQRSYVVTLVVVTSDAECHGHCSARQSRIGVCGYSTNLTTNSGCNMCVK